MRSLDPGNHVVEAVGLSDVSSGGGGGSVTALPPLSHSATRLREQIKYQTHSFGWSPPVVIH